MSRLTPRSTPPALALFATLACTSCHRKSSAPVEAGSAAPANSVARPVDHLASDELAAGTADVWGFVVPRDMRIEHVFPEIAYVVGPVQPDALANYVRERVTVSHVEIGAGRTIFPNAHIKGGSDHYYELDVIPEPGGTRLQIQDLTPVKVTPGLSDEERWKQAGLTPQGRPLDMKKFE